MGGMRVNDKMCWMHSYLYEYVDGVVQQRRQQPSILFSFITILLLLLDWIVASGYHCIECSCN